MPILTDNERKVMEIILDSKKPIDQREVVRKTDFSKSKVSRIVQNLTERKIIEKIPKGRTNILKLKIKEKTDMK